MNANLSPSSFQSLFVSSSSSSVFLTLSTKSVVLPSGAVTLRFTEQVFASSLS